MAVSNSTDFSLNTVQIIQEALALIGAEMTDEPLKAHEFTWGLRALNMMLRTWQADGVMTWTLTEGTFSLVLGQPGYAFGSGGVFTTVPLDITDVRITRAGRDLPMYRMSRDDYYALPIKTNQGYPTQFYYDRQRDGGTLFVWPAPDAALGTIGFTYRRYVMDLTTSTNNIDLPKEWYEAIVYNLAKKLLPRFGGPNTTTTRNGMRRMSPEAQLVLTEADTTYKVLKGFDVGEGQGSISITPWGEE